MKNLICKKFNILEIVLILSPIIDILTSVSQRKFNIDISLGLIVRSFLLFFITVFMLVKSNYKYKKITITYLALVVIYSVIFIINMFLTKGNTYIITEIKELVKAFYFPLCLIAILNYVETKDYKIDLKVLFFVMIEYVILLFLPSMLNLGYESYVEDKIGTIGWFFSANEISSIYSILVILVVFGYKYIKNLAIYFGLLIVSFYTILQIGTKMPAISAIITIASFLAFYLIRYLSTKNKEFGKYLIAGLGVMCIFTIIFLTSPVVKNYNIYKNYLIATREQQESVESNAIPTNEKHENEKAEDNSADVNETKTYKPSTENNKDEKLTDDEFATIIHSGRLETLSNINSKYSKSSVITKMIGLGRIDIENKDEFLIEIDYFDILYNFGILGFIIYFVPVIIIAVAIIKNIIKNKLKTILIDEYAFCCIVLILTGVMCAVAGHTLVAPAVSIYIAMALIGLFRRYESN